MAIDRSNQFYPIVTLPESDYKFLMKWAEQGIISNVKNKSDPNGEGQAAWDSFIAIEKRNKGD